MMPVLKREPVQPLASSAGFTLVEVVVSSSILALALAGSFSGWRQGEALVRQANQRQVILDAVEQDLQRQQGLVIQTLKTKPPWACEVSLDELREGLEALSHDLPEAVERQWFMEGASPALAIRYSSAKLQAPRERLLALRRRGSVCDEAICDDEAMATGPSSGDQGAAGGGIQPGGTAGHCCSPELAGGPCAAQESGLAGAATP